MPPSYARRIFPMQVLFGALLFAIVAETTPQTFAAGGGDVKVINDFEHGNAAPFEGGKVVDDGAPQGKKALQMTDAFVASDAPMDWTGYQYLRFEVFNPTPQPVNGGIEVRDKQTRDYWTRVNAGTVYPPGRSTISFPTNLFVGEKARPGRRLLTDQITRFVIMGQKGIVIDNIRLERQPAAPAVPGMIALDFGTPESPVMEGFTQATTQTTYTAEPKLGWERAIFWRAFDMLQPDALFQDFVVPTTGAVFRADLPNGTYHVWMNIDSPGGFWGEPQVYDSRKVTANGKTVVDEKMTYDSFLARHFRNASTEDLPGEDVFRKHVEPTFAPKAFDVEVTDGSLRLSFEGESWANCLSAMVIYPATKSAEGETFLKWVTDRRRDQFNNSFKQVIAKKGEPPASGNIIFTRDPQKPVNPYDAPEKGERLGAEGLSITLAGDEEAPVTFAVQPAGSTGPMEVAVSALKDPAGHELAGLRVQPGWLDYRLQRVQADGSVYTVAPRYWHPTPAPAASVTRRFWIRIKAPASILAGTYKGTITLKIASVQRGDPLPTVIPITLHVLPFSIDRITDIAAGPFGSSWDLPWLGSDPRTAEWNRTMFEKTLTVLQDAGCTSFTGRPSLRVKAHDGKIELDTADADREMQSLRSHGFTHVISSYGSPSDLGYQIYGTGTGPDETAAKRAGFSDMRSFLEALYGAIDAHAVERDWPTIAWNLCDEPLADAAAGAAANVKAHREILPGLKRTTFTGATSLYKSTANEDLTKNPHYELTRALPIPSLNLHDAAALEVLKGAGNQFCFYNGGNRWTFGRYMKAMVVNQKLVMRHTWHYNVTAGDPYYALDAREDDYCWFNCDAKQTLVPSIDFLAEILPGLNDYRYLSTLQRLLKDKPSLPAAGEAKKVFDKMTSLRPGADRGIGEGDAAASDAGAHPDFVADRAAVIRAIESLR